MNKQTTPSVSTILQNKLARATIKLQSQVTPEGFNQNFNTAEKAVMEGVKALSAFYKYLGEPGYNPIPVEYDVAPEAAAFNNNLEAIEDDLHVIFSEFENLESVVLGEFNYMTSRLNRLNRKLKSVSSQLGDFILFSDLPTKDALFFTDSFNNLARVEVNTPLLNAEQCEVNQVEGIATLPIDRAKQVLINVTDVPVINSNSNGSIGNNQELNQQLHGTIADILDNNADTWFEYERVVSSDDGVALVLDFTINLGSSKVINFVRVNPNNFGTRTQVQIVAIDTSVDGKDFVSIKDDIPIASFTTEDEENVFTLAPSTSKFAGQGLYTFTPRKAKYVHLTLRQITPYVVDTSTGERLRYAIGVRDVDIQALPYKGTGELISTNYELTDEIRKVVILSNQSPVAGTSSNLASIEHYLSPDNGVTWHQLRPSVSSGEAGVDQSIPELLDFNGVAADSISTSNAVNSLRYKAVLKRDTEAFTEDAAELAQEIAAGTELHSPPTTTPFSIQLQKTPIATTLKLVDPQLGSRGKEDAKYQIASGNNNKLNILLPFSPLVRDVQKVWDGATWTLRDRDPEQLYIDGELWTRGALTGTNQNYRLNYEEGRIITGDGTNGAVVPTGAAISMTLNEEQLFPARGSEHIAQLDYPTANDKGRVEVSLLKPISAETTVLKKGAVRHQLKTDMVYDPDSQLSYTGDEYKFVISATTDVFLVGQEQEFVDGSVELTASGQYSFDFRNGMLHAATPTKQSEDATITYFYNPRVVLNEDEWDFVDTGDGISNAISIRNDLFQTFPVSNFSVPVGARYFNLQHMSTVQGTLKFTDSGGTPDSLAIEVPFVDGRTELLDAIPAAEELAAITGVNPAGEVITIAFTLKISSDTNFAVSFTDQTTFSTVVGGTPGALGEYKVNRGTGNTGTIDVYLEEGVAEPGTVSYYYVDPKVNLDGRYSVNYKTGEVFCYTPTETGTTAAYEYTNYRIKYDIARLVPSSDWTYNASENLITIEDREILRNTRIPQQANSAAASSPKFYQLSYNYIKSTRDDVSELEPYFSPVLKDYVLKVITKSRLV